MNYRIFSIGIALLLGGTSYAQEWAASCSELADCVQRGDVAVIGADDLQEQILATAETGATRFEAVFLKPIRPTAIVSGGEISTLLSEQISEAGFDVTLPWVSAADRDTLRRNSVLAQVREQTKNMPEAQRKAIEETALAQLAARSSGAESEAPSTMGLVEQGALTHELGHVWFKAAFPAPAGTEETKKQYGGWAPDWLDETAAVLLENDTLTEGRREAFLELAVEDLFVFEDFFTMRHPSFEAAMALQERLGVTDDGAASGSKSRVLVLSDEEAAEFMASSDSKKPVNFYLQARGLADYFAHVTGDDAVFANLSTHFSDGGDMTSWLATRADLPDTIAALESDWLAWREDLVAAKAL